MSPSKKKGVKQRMTTVTLSHFHFAMMDFLVARLGMRQFTRADVIRQSIESYIPQHRLWDNDAFTAFVAEQAKTIKNPLEREAMHEHLEVFLSKRYSGGEVFRMAEPWDLDVGTTASLFKW